MIWYSLLEIHTTKNVHTRPHLRPRIQSVILSTTRGKAESATDYYNSHRINDSVHEPVLQNISWIHQSQCFSSDEESTDDESHWKRMYSLQLIYDAYYVWN